MWNSAQCLGFVICRFPGSEPDMVTSKQWSCASAAISGDCPPMPDAIARMVCRTLNELMRPRELTVAGAVVLALLATGCVTSTFVAPDGRAVDRPITHPSIFIDRLPPIPFHSIGIIEVKAPAGSTLDTVVEEATRKGSEIGCDFVVDRSIYRVSYGI